MFDYGICSRLKPMYYSKLHDSWRECRLREIPLYKKYGYKVKLIDGGITKDYLI